ncbi:WD40 repeat domain-containing protein [Leptolyngbya sp. AN02str]|uniref:WD40 repeat domain-containing protein n=1 Tax=Leptolyngbya sp. AN02str TaxID=3423363 RepID=UPI003D311D7C
MEIQRVSQWQIQQSITSLAFQAGTSRLFTGNQAGNIHYYDFKGGLEVATLQWHKSPVVELSCCENYLYSFDKLQNLACWNINTLQVERTHTLSIENIPIYGRTAVQDYSSTSSVPWTVEFAQFTPNGEYLIFGIYQLPRNIFTKVLSTLYMVDTKTASLVRTFDWGLCGDGHIDTIAISKDGTQLAASGLDIHFSSLGEPLVYHELIYQWCIEDGECVCNYGYDPIDKPGEHTRIGLAFSPDNQKILLSQGDGIGGLSLWDVPPLESRCMPVRAEYWENRLFLDSSGIVDWSPTNDFVALGSPDGFLRFVDIENAAILSKPPFSWSAEQSVHIKNVAVLLEQQVFQSGIEQLWFSQTGEFLALSSQDLMLEVWQIL